MHFNWFKNSHVTYSNQSDCLISVYHTYATLKFIYDIDFCSQSYKQFTLVIYESRVVIWGRFKSGTTLES